MIKTYVFHKPQKFDAVQLSKENLMSVQEWANGYMGNNRFSLRLNGDGKVCGLYIYTNSYTLICYLGDFLVRQRDPERKTPFRVYNSHQFAETFCELS
jgi:hypothetical protein